MAQQDLIRKTQFEHIVKYPLLSSIMKEIHDIEKFYGKDISEKKLFDDLEERLKEDRPMLIADYIDIAAVAIVAAKLIPQQQAEQ